LYGLELVFLSASNFSFTLLNFTSLGSGWAGVVVGVSAARVAVPTVVPASAVVNTAGATVVPAESTVAVVDAPTRLLNAAA
jgi:hypothetical protein